MDQRTSFDSESLPDLRLFQLIAAKTRAFLDSLDKSMSDSDLPVESHGALAPMANWYEQLVADGVPVQQIFQENPFQPRDLLHTTDAVGSVSPDCLDYGVMQTQVLPMALQVTQLAMSDSPLIGATSATLTTAPYSPLFSTGPSDPTVTSASGQNLSYGTSMLSHIEQQSPSEIVYNMSVNTESYPAYSSFDPSYSGHCMEDRPTPLHTQLYPPQLCTPQSEPMASPLFAPEDAHLPFRPSPSYSPAPDARLPSPPKSVSGCESDLYMDTDEEEEERRIKPRRRNRARKPTKSKGERQTTPVKLLACNSTLSNEYSVQRHINRSKLDSLCHMMRVYSFMKSKTEPKKTVRFFPKRPHGKKTAVVDLHLIRAKFGLLESLQLKEQQS
ncbi:hypothetical protein DFQ27_007847 [Actinomortierella ambigua]|uniref:Uncharacterized protein n=1 Tax=Actinomortierella ambigua TaxID=1343610 RepID=A0A9P6UBU4_9FUNG|nr:hypothetical protein DFQ27_007847 [Actinomortierella ambigua]